ncbi:MAG: hypothetical protein WCD81_08450 [Candidatus Bathyarchaeia archaeon]
MRKFEIVTDCESRIVRVLIQLLRTINDNKNDANRQIIPARNIVAAVLHGSSGVGQTPWEKEENAENRNVVEPKTMNLRLKQPPRREDQ